MKNPSPERFTDYVVPPTVATEESLTPRMAARAYQQESVLIHEEGSEGSQYSTKQKLALYAIFLLGSSL